MSVQISNEVLELFKKRLEQIMVGGLSIELVDARPGHATIRISLTDAEGQALLGIGQAVIEAGCSLTVTGIERALNVVIGV